MKVPDSLRTFGDFVFFNCFELFPWHTIDVYDQNFQIALVTYLRSEKYEHEAERAKIYDLIAKRDSLKRSGSNPEKLASIRAELKDLISVWKDTGYTYCFKTYREIGMQNSNYGGMENLNNTTKEEKSRKKRKQKVATRLEEMYRSRFEALYSKHAPHKFKKISSVMAKYSGNLGEALAAAEEKYAGEAGPPLPAALVSD
ncbi:hypothetical protein TrVE_jg6359 [Triparma verrucosa]|uniref:Uncharacterized protein n=1 Tax=Triparma verrucosa TaxID=1606542 RepID=A0A9W7EPW5_9STRA|nr:hypothetical protein TrVE_jg6359 [Triparma verrucosa]